jgi:SAM-dependent methyltransferase
MLPETYRMVAEREDTYWWQVARRAMSIRLLRQSRIPRGGRWLDLGCGPGSNLLLSASFAGDLSVGLDLSPIALSIASLKKPQARLVRADLNRALPFADAAFDAVTTFNVLYHDWITNEASIIAEVRRVLRPGGVFLITEPAFPILTRQMDIAAMGQRRYRLSNIVQFCSAAGLHMERASYFTSFGFPLLLAMKPARLLMSAGQTKTSADMKPLNPIANNLLLWLSAVEACAIAAGFRIPFGTTLLCLARKVN